VSSLCCTAFADFRIERISSTPKPLPILHQHIFYEQGWSVEYYRVCKLFEIELSSEWLVMAIVNWRKCNLILMPIRAIVLLDTTAHDKLML